MSPNRWKSGAVGTSSNGSVHLSNKSLQNFEILHNPYRIWSKLMMNLLYTGTCHKDGFGRQKRQHVLASTKQTIKNSVICSTTEIRARKPLVLELKADITSAQPRRNANTPSISLPFSCPRPKIMVGGSSKHYVPSSIEVEQSFLSGTQLSWRDMQKAETLSVGQG